MKFHIILEKFWLVIAIITSLLTVYLMFKDGFNPAKYYLLITGLVWGMYLIRKGIRKRLEKIENEKNKNSKN